MDQSIPKSLYLSLLNNSHSTAFSFNGVNFTYQQLAQRIACIQSTFLKPGNNFESIGIISNQDFDTYSTLIAALISGITYVPIEASHPDERNNHIIRISKVEAIFCSDTSVLNDGFYETHKLKFVQLDTGMAETESLQLIEKENPAYILFTSGTTGIPKGVPISFRNLQAFIENVDAMQLGINAKSRFLQVFDLTFDLSVFSYLVPLLNGASVFNTPNDTFKNVASVQFIQEHEITHLLSVPSFVNFLKPYYSRIKLPSIKHWLFCGEALKSDMVIAWMNCLPNASLYNVYGPTEATIFCTSYKCPVENIKEYHGMVSIGKPFNGTTLQLFENEIPVIQFDTTAELTISGAQLSSGYFEDDEKSKSVFFTFENQINYKTGDLCLVDSDGDFYFAGRNDSQVKINGYRIEISELEFHARNISEIDEAVVIVSTNEKSDQQLLNLIYSSKTEKLESEIKSELSTKLPPYMLPGKVFYIKNIPYNLNGKIDKKALSEQIKNNQK